MGSSPQKTAIAKAIEEATSPIRNPSKSSQLARVCSPLKLPPHAFFVREKPQRVHIAIGSGHLAISNELGRDNTHPFAGASRGVVLQRNFLRVLKPFCIGTGKLIKNEPEGRIFRGHNRGDKFNT